MSSPVGPGVGNRMVLRWQVIGPTITALMQATTPTEIFATRFGL